MATSVKQLGQIKFSEQQFEGNVKIFEIPDDYSLEWK